MAENMSPTAERDRISFEDWKAEARRRFGPEPLDWRFVCVRCGHVQTMRDFMDAGMTREDAQNRVYYSCIGRWVDGVGCDWTLGGLFQFHELEVQTPDGQLIPAFRFAEPEGSHA